MMTVLGGSHPDEEFSQEIWGTIMQGVSVPIPITNPQQWQYDLQSVPSNLKKYFQAPYMTPVKMTPTTWYLKDANDNYTSTTPVNLLDGNHHKAGTYVTTESPKPVTDTVAFYTKNGNDKVLVSKVNASGILGSSYNINTAFNNAKDASGNNISKYYSLAQGTPTSFNLASDVTTDIDVDGKQKTSSDINEDVSPDPANADIQYQYNNGTVFSDTTDYKGNNYQATDAGDNGTTISDNNEKGLPAGWHLANKDTSISYDNGKHPVAIDPNHVSDNVIYQYNGQNVNNGYQLGSHSFGGNDYRATQAGNNGMDITQNNATGLRSGYSLVNADNKIQFDGQTKYIAVKPVQVSDKGTLTLNYVESNGHVDKTVTLHPAIKGNVDDTLTLAKPLDYAEDNYTVPSGNFTWTIKPGKNANEPSKTFTYNAPTAGNVTIQYYDTSTGHHLTQFDKTLKASDMEKAPYSLDWIVGNQVELGIKGSNDKAIDVLQAPAGYHFVKNYPVKSVILPEAKHGLTLHVGLMLTARPASSSSAAPSSASAQPSSASQLVAPSASSAAPSSVAPQSTSASAPARQVIDHGYIAPTNNETPSDTEAQPSDITPTKPVKPVHHSHANNNAPVVHNYAQPSVQPSRIIEHKNTGKAKASVEPKAVREANAHAVKVQHEAASHMADVGNALAQPEVHAADVRTPRISATNAKQSTTAQHKLPQTNEKAAGLMGASAIMAALGLASADVDRKRRHN